jgi:hypothetical protein
MTDAPLVVTPDDLALFLGAQVEDNRALMMLDLAKSACSTILDPLTAPAKFVVLSAAARAYSTPVPVGAQTVGPYAASGMQGGITLDRREERQLRRLAGGGGAFSIDPLATDAGTDVPWWDTQAGPVVSTS